jgi:capsule polysaccharide export protein KpsE/RkpR
MSQANVRSVEALKDFKNALIAYAEEARNALNGVDMEVRRTRDWLDRDQLMYWQTQVKKRNEMVSQARADLFRRQISQGNSGSVSDSDQKEALRIAIQRLRNAEEKLAKVKKWGPVLDHAIAEYNSAARPLGDRISGDLVNSLALLDRMAFDGVELQLFVGDQALRFATR